MPELTELRALIVARGLWSWCAENPETVVSPTDKLSWPGWWKEFGDPLNCLYFCPLCQFTSTAASGPYPVCELCPCEEWKKAYSEEGAPCEDMPTSPYGQWIEADSSPARREAALAMVALLEKNIARLLGAEGRT
jgi:hypothetical protein